MGPTRLLLLLLLIAAVLVHGRSCPKKKFFKWEFYSNYYKAPGSANMTTLDKSLADDPSKYIECFSKEEFPHPVPGKRYMPLDGEFKWTQDVYGRKKRDIRKGAKYYTKTGSHVEIPFLISANWTTCQQRRIALAFRKWEMKTCLKFIPFENLEKHPQVVIITNAMFVDSWYPIAPFGRGSIAGTTLDGKTISDGTVIQLPRQEYRAIEHELMHTLGFVHSEESPYREGPQEWWTKTDWPAPGSKDGAIQLGPWERNSAISNVGGDKMLTDWDGWKVNKFYECEVTTIGNKKIDINNKPPPPVNTFNDDPTRYLH